jgi:murein L,D-transpeptidase YcbB/YkuD
VPVFVTYLTAWPDEHGVIQFRSDIYNRDQKAIADLAREKKQANATAENQIAAR